jgi:hypothetical protein
MCFTWGTSHIAHWGHSWRFGGGRAGGNAGRLAGSTWAFFLLVTLFHSIFHYVCNHRTHFAHFRSPDTQVQSLSQGGWGPGPEWESSSRFDFGPPESSRGLWGGHLPRALVILRPPLGSSAETRGKRWGNNIHWILKLDFEEHKLS